MNLDGNDDAQLELRSDLADKPIDQYLMTAPEAEGVLSLYVRCCWNLSTLGSTRPEFSRRWLNRNQLKM